MIRVTTKRNGAKEESYYLNIPREVAKSLQITKEDKFELNIRVEDGDIVLCFRRVKST